MSIPTALRSAPNGWKFFNLLDPNKLDSSDLVHYPVLIFGPCTYTALSSINDNIDNMLVVAWDMNRNLVKILEKAGARYIWQITFDPANQAVTFTGNSSQSIQFTLDELAVRPSVVSLPSPTAGPVLPYILTYAAADVWQFPVIKNGPYSFWPVSSKAQSNTFVVVVVDSDNLIQEFIECPGGSKIQDVQINDANHAIVLHGQGNSTVPFDYDTTMACYSCCYNITKDDFLFLAQYFNLPLSDAEATALATAMPQINCALCCRMQGTFTKESGPEKRSTDPVTVGFFLGGIIGAFGGFLIGGVLGIAPGWVAGTAAGIGIGQTVPPSSDLGPYKLSSLEINHSLVGYSVFPCGPFNNTGLKDNIFDYDFPRYQDLPYSAAVTKLDGASVPQAYSPATKSIGAFPRDPRYNTRTLANGTGIQVAKYIFVIVKSNETINGQPGYQMRINPEDFYPDSFPAKDRVNHSQLSEGYRFWALVGEPHMQVYAAGSLYATVVNPVGKQKIVGIDTRTGHYFRSFKGHDQEISDATLKFLSNLGYPSFSMLGYADIVGYFQSYR